MPARNQLSPIARAVDRFRAWFDHRDPHPCIRANHALFREELDQDRPLEEYTYLVVDTELTGLNPRKDEIVSIGAVRIRGRDGALCIDPSDCRHALVRPPMDLPKLSTLIHRITPQQIKDAPPLAEVLPGFVDYAGDSLLVGHHVGLDMSFLNRAALKILRGRIINPCLDTMRMAQVYQAATWEHNYEQFRLKVSYNLGSLTREYGLPRFGEHDALQDALQAAYLFLFLVGKLKEGGVRTLRDLYDAGRTWRWYL